MGCCISAEPPPKPVDEPYPEDGKKLRADAAVEDVYELGTTIGHGGFSKVKLATHRKTGEQWACKIMPLPHPGHYLNEYMTTRSAILQEIDALLDLEHPNIASLKEYFVQHNTVYLIMELLRGGELLDAVVEKGHYSEEDARIIFRQLIGGVQYLHAMGVVHRDLKLDNLLLDYPGDISSIKIADFGFAKKHPRGKGSDQKMKTICGTPEYTAPEVLRCSKKVSGARSGRDYGPACDLWSCGVILYELLGGSPPFHDSSQPRLFRQICKGIFSFSDPVWAPVSPQAKQLIRELLLVDPGRRLTADQVLQHPWMRQTAQAAHLPETSARMQSNIPHRAGKQQPLQDRINAALAAADAGTLLPSIVGSSTDLDTELDSAAFDSAGSGWSVLGQPH